MESIRISPPHLTRTSPPHTRAFLSRHQASLSPMSTHSSLLSSTLSPRGGFGPSSDEESPPLQHTLPTQHESMPSSVYPPLDIEPIRDTSSVPHGTSWDTNRQSTEPGRAASPAAPCFRASGAGQRMVSVDNPLAQQMTGIRGDVPERFSVLDDELTPRPSTARRRLDARESPSRRQEAARESTVDRPGLPSPPSLPSLSSHHDDRPLPIHTNSFAREYAELGLTPLAAMRSPGASSIRSRTSPDVPGPSPNSRQVRNTSIVSTDSSGMLRRSQLLGEDRHPLMSDRSSTLSSSGGVQASLAPASRSALAAVRSGSVISRDNDLPLTGAHGRSLGMARGNALHLITKKMFEWFWRVTFLKKSLEVLGYQRLIPRF